MKRFVANKLSLEMCLALLALVLMAACSKADGTGESVAPRPVESGRSAVVTANRNELVVNDTVYPLLGSAFKAPNDRYTVMGRCPEGDVLYLFTADALPFSMGKNYDLTDATPDVGYDFAVSGERVLNFSLSNVGGYFYGTLQGNIHDGSTVFASGTLDVTLSHEALEYKIDGVLIDGTTVSLYVYVPENEIDDNGYCGGSVE